MTEPTTCGDLLRTKWIERAALLGRIDARKAEHKTWLATQEQHQRYELDMRGFKLSLDALERSMDECARLGDGQEDFLG